MRPMTEYSTLPKFSHIYVEKGVKEYPLTHVVLARFPKATLIEIDRYQEVFNRSRQDWREAKSAQKLILAKKEAPFLYRATDVIQGAHDRFFYTTPILNCIYDCDYCFLQGKFTSPHAVIFVNEEDFFGAASAELVSGPITLSPSYETDLLGFQKIVPWASKWIEYAAKNPSLTLELRSKSASYQSIKQDRIPTNVILSWTISPSEIVQKYEKGTPRVEARLNSAQKALEDGWKVRLCLDPILVTDKWQECYRAFLSDLTKTFPVKDLYDFWVGTFRISSQQLERIKSQRDDSDILYYPFIKEGDVSCYPNTLRNEATSMTKEYLSNVRDVVYW